MSARAIDVDPNQAGTCMVEDCHEVGLYRVADVAVAPTDGSSSAVRWSPVDVCDGHRADWGIQTLTVRIPMHRRGPR